MNIFILQQCTCVTRLGKRVCRLRAWQEEALITKDENMKKLARKQINDLSKMCLENACKDASPGTGRA